MLAAYPPPLPAAQHQSGAGVHGQVDPITGVSQTMPPGTLENTDRNKVSA